MATNFQQAPAFQAFTSQMASLKQHSQTYQQRATENIFTAPEQNTPLVDANLNTISAIGTLQSQIDGLKSVISMMAGQVGTKLDTQA